MSKSAITKLLPALAVVVLLGGGCSAVQKDTAKEKSASTATTVQVFESYDCDKLKVKNVTVAAGEDPVRTVLKYLPGPGGNGTVAQDAQDFKVDKGVAYIDWSAKISELPNIDTSCAVTAFLNPIEKTLVQFDSIDAVIHSMNGNVGAFYHFMGLACPKGNTQCEEYLSGN